MRSAFARARPLAAWGVGSACNLGTGNGFSAQEAIDWAERERATGIQIAQAYAPGERVFLQRSSRIQDSALGTGLEPALRRATNHHWSCVELGAAHLEPSLIPAGFATLVTAQVAIQE